MDIKQTLLGSTNHKNVLDIFAGIASKRGKVGPTFSSFRSMSILAVRSFKTDDREQFQYRNIALSYKTGPLFLEFNVCKQKF